MYESLLAKLPTADDENDDRDGEEEQEGTPEQSADAGQAAGDCLAIATRWQTITNALP